MQADFDGDGADELASPDGTAAELFFRREDGTAVRADAAALVAGVLAEGCSFGT